MRITVLKDMSTFINGKWNYRLAALDLTFYENLSHIIKLSSTDLKFGNFSLVSTA